MRHSVLISLMLPTLMWGMNEQGPYQLKEADFDLWRAIDDGDDNGVLAALKAGAKFQSFTIKAHRKTEYRAAQ